DAGTRTPLLFLLLGSPPLVRVTKHGRKSVAEAISLYLHSVLSRMEGHSIDPDDALSRIEEVVCWITWNEISQIVESQLEAFDCSDSSLRACIARLARSVTEAIARHG